MVEKAREMVGALRGNLGFHATRSKTAFDIQNNGLREGGFYSLDRNALENALKRKNPLEALEFEVKFPIKLAVASAPERREFNGTISIVLFDSPYSQGMQHFGEIGIKRESLVTASLTEKEHAKYESLAQNDEETGDAFANDYASDILTRRITRTIWKKLKKRE